MTRITNSRSAPAQFAVEAEIVLEGADTIRQLRHVHQHAEWATHPAAHGRDAVPHGLVLGLQRVAIRRRQAAHASAKRIRLPPDPASTRCFERLSPHADTKLGAGFGLKPATGGALPRRQAMCTGG